MGEVRHGTLRKYQAHSCRCPLCRAAKSKYTAERARLIAYGRWSAYSDPEPVRAHVKALMTYGLTAGAIADLAGVDNGCVAQIVTAGHLRGPLAINAQSLLAVRFDLDRIPDRIMIDATGSRRRVQALMVLGYPLKTQAARLDRTVNNYYKVLRNRKVFVSTARAIRNLYDDLSMTPAPPSHGATLARSMAARNGWLPPLAWDDDLIDVPDHELVASLRRESGLMDMQELQWANNSRYKHGDTSPLTLAASREYKRRQKTERRDLGEAS